MADLNTADLDIAAEALPDSRQVMLIPTANPHFPLMVTADAYAGDHLQLSLHDGFGTRIWEVFLVPRGGGELLADVVFAREDDDG